MSKVDIVQLDVTSFGEDLKFGVLVNEREIASLNVGIKLDKPLGKNTVRFYPVHVLIEEANNHILGLEGSGIELRYLVVEEAECFVTMCLEINGKVCKLRSEELTLREHFGLSLKNQLKTFWRLMLENQITLDDLAVADINLNIYKKLCSFENNERFKKFMHKLAKLIKKCYENKYYHSFYEEFEGTEKLNYWLKLAEK